MPVVRSDFSGERAGPLLRSKFNNQDSAEQNSVCGSPLVLVAAFRPRCARNKCSRARALPIVTPVTMKTRRGSGYAPKPADGKRGKLKVAKKASKPGKRAGGKVNAIKVAVGKEVVIAPKANRPKRSARGSSNSKESPATVAAAAVAAPPSEGGRASGAKLARSSARRASAAARAAPRTSIAELSVETLQEVFHLIGDQGHCRETLPLVCKRFRELLAQPSPVWETLQLNFLDKGAPGFAVDLSSEDDLAEAWEAGRRRRLLRSAIEHWLKPRAAAVKRLLIMFSSCDPTHSFSTGGRGLRPLLTLLPGLRELSIHSCSDIFHGQASFQMLVGMQQLQVLSITHITTSLAATDLAPLEQLKCLKSLTLHCSRSHEEMAGTCFRAFPDVLLKLKGLQQLAFTSLGVAHIPTGITRLKQLAALDVSGTPISFLPQNLWRCSELRHLRLNGTNLVLCMPHSWEPLVKLSQLEVLELRETKTRALPATLNGLKALTALDLSDNIFEHSLYQGHDALACLGFFPSLQRLELRRCQLSTVPNVMCHLSHLKHLDLSHNYLVDLPEGLWLMHSLRELAVQGNSFPKIPEVLHKLPSLETVDMSFCIYMEACLSMDSMAVEGFKQIRSMDLRKMLGMWKPCSVKWLQRLNAALAAQGRPTGVIMYE